MALKQQLINWFFLEENENEKKPNLDKKQLEKGMTKAIKDLNLGKEALKMPYYRFIWNEIIKGNYKPTSYLHTELEPEVAVADIHIEHWRPKDEKFDPSLFVPFKTKKGIDIVLSDDGGPMKGTSYIVVGEPGVGKTTVLSDVQKCLQNNYKKAKIACVQSEMKKIDLGYEYTKKPWMDDLNYIILKELGYKNIKNALIKIFSSGYDIIFLDSIGDIVDKLKAFADMSSGEAENFILELMDKANDAKDGYNEGVNTTVFTIQQVTKGGDYKGSTKLKHMTTGMLELRKDARGNRYILFSKNRRGGMHVDKKLYYSLDKKTQEVVYDIDLFNESEEQAAMVKKEKENIRKNTENFMDVFGKSQVEVDSAEVDA
jgi:predicted ATPase